MRDREYDKVCYTTQQREDHVPLKNIRTGQIGFSYLCTEAGTTVQVRLENGDLDSWDKADCEPVDETSVKDSAMMWSCWDKNDVAH